MSGSRSSVSLILPKRFSRQLPDRQGHGCPDPRREVLTPGAGGFEAVVYDTPFARGIARAIWVAATGNINFEAEDGSSEVFAAVPIGKLDVRFKRVLSASTTVAAASLKALV